MKNITYAVVSVTRKGPVVVQLWHKIPSTNWRRHITADIKQIAKGKQGACVIRSCGKYAEDQRIMQQVGNLGDKCTLRCTVRQATRDLLT